MKKLFAFFTLAMSCLQVEAQTQFLTVDNRTGCPLEMTAYSSDRPGTGCGGNILSTNLININQNTNYSFDGWSSIWTTPPNNDVDWLGVRFYPDISCTPNGAPSCASAFNYMNPADLCGNPTFTCLRIACANHPCNGQTLTATVSYPCTGCIDIVIQ